MPKYMTITTPDGTVYGVPVEIIARHRAEYFADEFNNDVELSLKEDTLPLFNEDNFEIEDWAKNDMNWSDFEEHVVILQQPDKNKLYRNWYNMEIDFVG